MASLAWICLGWLLIAVGFIGCLLPVLPGPPIAWCALALLRLAGDGSAPSNALLAGSAALTVAVTVLDYVVPAWGARRFDCSRIGTLGCFVGTLVGMFFLPLGIVAGPFLGALVGELIAGRSFGPSFKSACGGLLGFLFGVVLKVVCCVLLGYWYFCGLPA